MLAYLIRNDPRWLSIGENLEHDKTFGLHMYLHKHICTHMAHTRLYHVHAITCNEVITFVYMHSVKRKNCLTLYLYKPVFTDSYILSDFSHFCCHLHAASDSGSNSTENFSQSYLAASESEVSRNQVVLPIIKHSGYSLGIVLAPP